ncbi:MAG TPA: hypothetical protein VJU77_14645 [Chthoniobacterales bacterium]|nr:hypothetical protein [Chthoniobacterales bacterium]
MQRNLSLAVGVAQAGHLAFLNGAINGARAFHEWAKTSSYESHLLVDDPDPVTVDVLRSKFDAMFSGGAPVHRLLLYFSGHGMIRDAEERLWFLSKWDTELRVVHVEMLRRRLMRYYNIEQIAIFADACSVLPSKIEQLDLSLDGVVSQRSGTPTGETQIDRFDASQDGDAALMLPFEDASDDRGVFSGVLLEALWGTKTNAFSKLKQNKITSGSLGSYLKTEVPRVAKIYNRELKPRISPTFEEADDIYFEADPTFKPPVLPRWPPPDLVIGPPGPKIIETRRLDAEWGSVSVPEDSTPFPESENTGQWLINKIDRLRIPGMGYNCIGIKIQGEAVKSLRTRGTKKTLWQNSTQKDLWLLSDVHSPESAEPVLIEFVDGMFASVTGVPNFTTHVIRDSRGVSGLVYQSTLDPNSTNRMAETALSAMENGTLRMDAVVDFATSLRKEKHRDPMLGVISAYLYDSVGDLGNIRRMAYYYVENGQPIPYDIALLAQVPGEMRESRLWVRIPAVPAQKPRTKAEKDFPWTFEKLRASEGAVAGFWPWMRQGWTYLQDPLDVESGLIRWGLSELIPRLRPGRFVMLDPAGGKRLSKLFDLEIARPRSL